MRPFQNEDLNAILENELSNGNTIAETTTWPPKCRLLIILKRRFIKPYETENKSIQYRAIKDPHYWHSEYTTENGSECLACKF